MSYVDRIKNHLAKYKNDNFPGLQNGIWKGNNKRYPHILPEENKFDNLLPTYGDDLKTYLIIQKIKLHKDFHHLNSSQAMCFNFFFPLYHEQKLELVTNYLGLKDDKVNYETVCFEKDGLEEQFGRVPTSFDFYFETISGKKIYFEIKYTETEFGKAKVNKDKFDTVYSKHLKPLNANFHRQQQFFDNYQVLRNLIHIGENSYVVFVYPTDNDGISDNANKVKSEILTGDFHNNFYAATWEKLFETISLSATNTRLSTQFEDFKNKYLVRGILLDIHSNCYINYGF